MMQCSDQETDDVIQSLYYDLISEHNPFLSDSNIFCEETNKRTNSPCNNITGVVTQQKELARTRRRQAMEKLQKKRKEGRFGYRNRPKRTRERDKRGMFKRAKNVSVWVSVCDIQDYKNTSD